jgi:hypothetical protein
LLLYFYNRHILASSSLILRQGLAITYGHSRVQGLSGFLNTTLRLFGISVIGFRSAFPMRNSSSSGSDTLLDGDGLTWLFILSHIPYLSDLHNTMLSYGERKDAYLLLSLPGSR